MRHLLNRLLVMQSETGANRAETTGTNDENAASGETVGWADLTDEEAVSPVSESGTEPVSIDTTVDTDDVVEIDAEQLLANVLNGVAAATFIVDNTGRISHLNQQARELFETTDEEAVGAPPAAVHGGKERIGHILRSGNGVTEQEETVVIAGKEKTLSRTITPFTDESGTIVGAMEVAKDVTAKAREAEKTDQLEAYQAAVIDDLQDSIVRLAEGDLTIDSTVPEPPAEFEEMKTVHEEFTELSEYLTTAVNNFQSVLSRLTLLADDLDDTSQELSSNSEEVAASVEEITHSIEEIDDGTGELAEETDDAERAASNLTATIEEITASIQEIDAQTTQASSLALAGVEDGTEAVGQIRTATDATSEITEEVRRLESKMEQVGETLDVITDIAEQTNLLALNANIEAARAGEHGDGFAVVADEIKQLAEESKDSATNIEQIIADAQAQTDAVAQKITDTNAEVSAGADAVETVVEQLEEIESAVERTSQSTAEVSDAVEEQANNMDSFGSTIDTAASMSEELSASVQQISAGLEQQATATDQVAGRADSLSETSEELYDRIEQFRLEKDESATLDDIDQ